MLTRSASFVRDRVQLFEKLPCESSNQQRLNERPRMVKRSLSMASGCAVQQLIAQWQTGMKQVERPTKPSPPRFSRRASTGALVVKQQRRQPPASNEKQLSERHLLVGFVVDFPSGDLSSQTTFNVPLKPKSKREGASVPSSASDPDTMLTNMDVIKEQSDNAGADSAADDEQSADTPPQEEAQPQTVESPKRKETCQALIHESPVRKVATEDNDFTTRCRRTGLKRSVSFGEDSIWEFEKTPLQTTTRHTRRPQRSSSASNTSGPLRSCLAPQESPKFQPKDTDTPSEPARVPKKSFSAELRALDTLPKAPSRSGAYVNRWIPEPGLSSPRNALPQLATPYLFQKGIDDDDSSVESEISLSQMGRDCDTDSEVSSLLTPSVAGYDDSQTTLSSEAEDSQTNSTLGNSALGSGGSSRDDEFSEGDSFAGLFMTRPTPGTTSATGTAHDSTTSFASLNSSASESTIRSGISICSFASSKSSASSRASSRLASSSNGTNLLSSDFNGSERSLDSVMDLNSSGSTFASYKPQGEASVHVNNATSPFSKHKPRVTIL